MSIRARNLKMFMLVSLSVAAAFAYNLVAMITPALFPPLFRIHGIISVYYEGAGVVVTLVLLG
jgi:P-type Cu+ transporter